MKTCSICKKHHDLTSYYCSNCRTKYVKARNKQKESLLPKEWSDFKKECVYRNKDIQENSDAKLYFLNLYKKYGLSLHKSKKQSVVFSDLELFFDSEKQFYYVVPTQIQKQIIMQAFESNLKNRNNQRFYNDLYDFGDRYYIIKNPDFLYLDKNYSEIDSNLFFENYSVNDSKIVLDCVYDNVFTVGTSTQKLLVLSYAKQI